MSSWLRLDIQMRPFPYLGPAPPAQPGKAHQKPKGQILNRNSCSFYPISAIRKSGNFCPLASVSILFPVTSAKIHWQIRMRRVYYLSLCCFLRTANQNGTFITSKQEWKCHGCTLLLFLGRSLRQSGGTIHRWILHGSESYISTPLLSMDNSHSSLGISRRVCPFRYDETKGSVLGLSPLGVTCILSWDIVPHFDPVCSREHRSCHNRFYSQSTHGYHQNPRQSPGLNHSLYLRSLLSLANLFLFLWKQKTVRIPNRLLSFLAFLNGPLTPHARQEGLFCRKTWQKYIIMLFCKHLLAKR